MRAAQCCSQRILRKLQMRPHQIVFAPSFSPFMLGSSRNFATAAAGKKMSQLPIISSWWAGVTAKAGWLLLIGTAFEPASVGVACSCARGGAPAFDPVVCTGADSGLLAQPPIYKKIKWRPGASEAFSRRRETKFFRNTTRRKKVLSSQSLEPRAAPQRPPQARVSARRTYIIIATLSIARVSP